MKKIIVIDDDPAIQDSVSLVFDPLHYQVNIYPDADSILAGNFELPHIFIIDKQLQGVDGLDLCRHLKTNSYQPHSGHYGIGQSCHQQTIKGSRGRRFY